MDPSQCCGYYRRTDPNLELTRDYSSRQSGPIRTTIEHSYSNRKVSNSYANVDGRWKEFVDAAIEGRNYGRVARNFHLGTIR